MFHIIFFLQIMFIYQLTSVSLPHSCFITVYVYSADSSWASGGQPRWYHGNGPPRDVQGAQSELMLVKY